MKFKSLFLTTAAAMAFAACSSDEPSNGGNNGNTTDEGSTMYLTVNITDANAMGRANEGDLVPGTDKNEHEVTSAHFFFFDKDKMFVTEANVWNGGDEGDYEPSDKEDNKGYNVEFQSNNVLVLQNLTQKNLPTYLITVLNAPDNLLSYIRETPRSMDQVRNFCDNLTWDNGDYFVMSTSSFTGGAVQYPGLYEDACYYANVIKPEFLQTEPITSPKDVPANKVVKIYVERLAAKFTLQLPDNKTKFPVDVTIAGNENDNSNNVEVGSTRVWVEIENFGVTGTEPTSYLSKNLDGLTNPFDNWNIAQLHRSYWGKSVNYDKNKDFKLDYTTFPSVTGAINGPVYSNETTADFKNIRTDAESESALTPKRVTNVVIKAHIYADEACEKELDLVLFSGVYYKKGSKTQKDQFIPYILNRLNSTGKLNYYIKTGTASEKNEDGTLNTANYTQVSQDNVDYAKDTTKGTGVFKLVSTLGADTQLYQLVTENNELVAKPVATSAFETALNSYFINEWPTAYTGGASVYYVPVEHLKGTNAGYGNNYDYTVTTDGQYGVVRNHWYQIEVSKVFRLGQGVFDPSDKSTEELIPENPSKETFGMAANINILSWKVVKQSVDL